MRARAAILYITLIAGMVALADAGFPDPSWVWLPVWFLASVCLGWVTREPFFAALPLIAIPIAIPFGLSQPEMGVEPLPIWFPFTIFAPFQVVAVFIGLGGRHLYERDRARDT